MKNLGLFYWLITMPFILILAYAYVFKSNFVIFLLLYIVYRQIIDTWRLVAIGAISKRQIWKAFIPFYIQTAYFKELYFKA